MGGGPKLWFQILAGRLHSQLGELPVVPCPLSSGRPPLRAQPAGQKVCGGVGLRQLDPPRAPWFAQPRAMVTLGAEGGYGRARRSQQREGGERSGRRAGTFSPTSAPGEAAQPPEPRKRQQVVSPLRRAAQLAAETPSGCRENLDHLETQADPLFSLFP